MSRGQDTVTAEAGRFDVQPFLDVLERRGVSTSVRGIGTFLGRGTNAVRLYLTHGFNAWSADHAATRLGLAPDDVWPDWSTRLDRAIALRQWRRTKKDAVGRCDATTFEHGRCTRRARWRWIRFDEDRETETYAGRFCTQHAHMNGRPR